MAGMVYEAGVAVLDASVRVAPLLLALLCLRPLGHRLPASHWHLLWVFSLLAVLLLPLLRPAMPVWPVSMPAMEPGSLPRIAQGTRAAGIDPSPLGTGAVVWVWAIGAFGWLARLGWGVACIARRAGGAPVFADARAKRLLRNSRQELGLQRDVALRLVGESGPPAAWGIFRATILLPASARTWSDERLRMVLLHELAHIRRGDAVARLLAEVAVALHWFNPLVWTGARLLRETSERACDDAVLQAGVAPAEYARELLDLIRTTPRAAMHPAVPGVLAGPLERRILGILGGGPRRPATRRARAALAAAVLGVILPLAALRLTPATSEVLPSSLVADYGAQYGVASELAALIARAAVDERVDVDLAFGLVRAESGFQTAEISSAGAVGLTQILPATAASIEPGVTREQLLDPAINLRLGFRLLRRHLDRYQGDAATALLAYHLGPGRLERIRSAGQRPPTEYVDRVLHATRAP